MKILGIAGSLRQGSFNKALLQAAVELAPEGMEIEIFDISDVPLFNQDLEANLPEAVAKFKEKISAADGILFVTPEYNYSIPGVLKNAIDWGTRPYGQNTWEHKPVAIMGATTGMSGTIRAQLALRQTFGFLNVIDMKKPEIYITKAADKFDDKGNLTDSDTRGYLEKFLQEFAVWVEKYKS